MILLFAQIGNVVTIQAASVQEQLQRIQQLREQQQQKKRQAAEAKRELALSAASQSDIIQKQVCMCSGSHCSRIQNSAFQPSIHKQSLSSNPPQRRTLFLQLCLWSFKLPILLCMCAFS